METRCRVKSCNCEFGLHKHHIVPKFTFPEEYELGKKYDLFEGDINRVYLCEKHHNIIHNLLGKVIWKNKHLTNVNLQRKIKQYTEWFLNNWKW